MKKIEKKDIDQKVFDLYDAYAHNKMDRKEFIEKLSLYAVGGLTISSLLSFVLPNYENTIQVAAESQELHTETIEYESPKGGGKIKAQLSRPKGATGKLPGIVVVHENRGLNPHIADVARRGALAGFITIAPDALSPLGGYPGNDDDGRAMQRKRDRNEMLEDFIAAFEYLRNHKECTGHVGVVGFCFGGWISNMMAVKLKDLKAAVPFYGSQPPLELVPDINAPLLLHYAELDERVNAGWPAYEKALNQYDKEYIAYIYQNTNHGFHNDSTPRYDEAAAKLAWSRTIEFFKEELA
ncbi:carboxymethylenebutenolidase [Zhouia amylolytica]|uniref:Carboxymethylenebutenolidase n=1 Tax=Zhouia amylolytica TaxID=376730 RepID=A0A1I6QT26_9FLAO|nr:dienelactone hydrolase family protein [Zhouia amylolytica]MCQ0112074.1 dienelactone hydrolase family protein [Zhouia amylolytica]SFS55530.1 carboxymethylenebutenolidase [Zhouia amylolytica]